jgi:phosphomannomutase
MTLRDLLAPLRAKYFISGEINTKVASVETVKARLADLAEKYKDGHTYTIDGFSAEFPDWHFNVRGSNTEPLLRLNLEAVTPTLMEQKRDEVLAVIRRA